nr:ATP-binding protein [Tabrizicola sp.]
METPLGSDLMRAALLGAFDPRALLGPTAIDGATRLRALAAQATEVQVQDRWLWMLTPDARRKGLLQLPAQKERSAVFKGLPPATGDALALALRQVLSGGRAPTVITRLRRSAPRGEDLPALLHLLQTVELLRSVGIVLEGWAADPDLPRKLARFAVQAEKAAASLQILPRKLFGRREELEAFHDFARTRNVRSPPFVLPEAVAPPAPTDPPTVILSGLGGSGKSTLLEALRRRLARDPSLLLVVFDLDQPSLRAGHPVALTQELLRQIGEERPDLDPKMSALRQSLRGGVASASEVGGVGGEASAYLGALSELNSILLVESGKNPFSLVFVFDTFEEALILGEGRETQIADWIARVGSHWLSPRVILSGREAHGLKSAALRGLAVRGSIVLGELGVRAGRALLRDRFKVAGVDAEELVPQLVDALGSDPLTLMLLARFAASLGKTGAALRKDLFALAKDEGSEVREKLDGEMRQTFLFTRILNRLPEQDLQALANPGLVLRRVTPELILD